MSDLALKRFIPTFIGPDGRPTEHQIRIALLPGDDLFGDIAASLVHLIDIGVGNGPGSSSPTLPIAAFIVGESMAITLDHASVKPAQIQCLLGGMVHIADRRLEAIDPTTLKPTLLDPASALVLWAASDDCRVAQVVRYWADLSTIGALSPLETLTTPKLYGNKLRLTTLIAGVASATLPPGIPVLDLMAGTGVVARTLSQKHPVFVNDANPYAALLARTQGHILRREAVPQIMEALRDPFSRNMQALSNEASATFEKEASFLHGDLDQDAFERFVAFDSIPVLPVRGRPNEGLPYRLALERYSNSYFGIQQSAELDSLRFSIDAAFPHSGLERDVCLSALIIAASNCTSGPHFAQPRSLGSLRAMRGIIERRARSVLWEFELAIVRLGGRPALGNAMIGASQTDWREALAAFKSIIGTSAAAVYVDPPYSKLQYSRYYHVLNVLLTYDYPSIEGSGRYPPKSQRFSSRFEYQPGTARREFDDLFAQCAKADLYLILSYGDRGFVPIDALTQVMARHFGGVDMYSEELRHHSQGTTLGSARGEVVEHILVGRPVR